jgi:hypothetical protein
MDVQAQDSGLHPTSSAVPPTAAPTAAAPAAAPRPITFLDPIYADTAPTPVVAQRAQPQRRRRADGAGVRLLRAAIVIAIVALLACAAVLGLVKTGVIDGHGGHGGSGSKGTPSATATGPPLAVPTGSSAQGASYTVDAGAFFLSIATGPGAAWVSVAVQGQKPVFTGIINPHSSRAFTLLGSSQVEVGAGGTTITLAAGHRTATLMPPVAPFTYQLATHQSQA